MLKCRGIVPPGVDQKELVNGVVGFNGLHEVTVGMIFEMPDEVAETPPESRPWFVIEGPAEAPAAQSAEGLTFAQAKGQFRPAEDDELPV